jgi:hypothetical protein
MVLLAKRTAASVLIAAALAAAMGTATAHAVAASDLFLRELDQHGIVYGKTNATAEVGVGVCKKFDQGESYPQVQAFAQILPGRSRLSPDEASVVIKAAIDTMCPQFKDSLPA